MNICGAAAGYLALAAVLWLFYRSVLVLVPAAAGCFLGCKVAESLAKEKEMQRVKAVFLDFLGAFASSIEAGETPDNAVFSAYRALAGLYSCEWRIMRELTELLRRIRMNAPVEEAFKAFAKSLEDNDIQRFAEVFSLTKRKGGDMLYVIRSAERTLTQKTSVRREIRTIIASKRLEASVMAVMPPGMILYFSIADSAFLEPLYSGNGRLVMTLLLFVYAACLYATVKLSKIEV